MVKSGTLALIGLVGVGGFLLSKKVEGFTGYNYSPQPSVLTIKEPITAKGYRVDGIAHKDDVGSMKILPIVNTQRSSSGRTSDMDFNATKSDVDKYNNSSTAIDKIRNAVKVLPKNKSDELKSNLDKLGWA